MRVGLIVVAALLTGAGPALAEPGRAPALQSQQPKPAQPVVLASAGDVKPAVPDAAQPAPAQPRHRLARVTTCRCGDPQPDEAADDSPER